MKTKLKDNKIYKIIIIPICLILSFFGQFIPPINGLSSEAIGLILIFISTLILWLTIGISWPSLLCLLALGFLNNFGFNKTFSSSFGSPTFAFLLFTFICTYALSKTTLIKRIAINFINLKIAKRHIYSFIFFLFLGILFLGLFISPTVLFVILLPLVDEIISILEIDNKSKLAKILYLGLGFSVSLSSGMTPIAHVFPLLAINAASLDVSTFSYMALAMPSGFLVFILMYLIFILYLRKDYKVIDFSKVSDLKKDLPKLNRKEITILIIFIFILLLWILPSIFEYIYYPIYEFFNKYGTIMPPLLGTLLLCIIEFKNEPLLNIEEAFKKGIPRSSLIMCASTLALGEALKDNNIGLMTYLEDVLGASLINLSPIILLIIFIIRALIQTNLSSNMVTATLVSSIASTIIISSNTSLNLEATICIIGMLSSFAFATPPSMPHIAILSSKEASTTKDFLIFGSILMLICFIISLLISYPLGTLIF